MRSLLSRLLPIVATSLLFGLVIANKEKSTSWKLSASYTPKDFLDELQWVYFVTSPTNKDPTNGIVQYVSGPQAKDKYEISVVEDSIYKLKIETTEEIKDLSQNRSSVRITSRQSFGDGIYVLNVTHSPMGCASWPAIWTVTEDIDNWPVGGEIDLMEGANDEFNYGLFTLHTETGCEIPDVNRLSTASGTIRHANCSAFDSYNFGCQFALNGTKKSTWGERFNSLQGGLLVMERALGLGGDGIKAWFWNQGDEDIPEELKFGKKEIKVDSTKEWGLPMAHFPVQKCSKYFGHHNLVLNIDLSGDWAFNTYNQTGCFDRFGPINDHVRYNGSYFEDSFWGVDNIRIFSKGGGDRNADNDPLISVDMDVEVKVGDDSDAETDLKKRHDHFKRSKRLL